MSFYRKKKSNFGVYIAAGVLVFLLNIFSALFMEIEPKGEKENSGQTEGNTESQTTEEREQKLMKVHFLDVGQGLSILVQLGDEVLVYDGGGYDASSFVVAYLKEQEITEIDYLISSHYDADHVSGLIGCLYAFDVKQVIGSDYVHDSTSYSSFVNATEKEGVRIEHPSVGTQYSFGEAVVTILAPAEIVDDSNANSVAIKLSYRESDFIFTGDADYISESAMIASEIDLECEVLSVGHHGSSSATSAQFLEATTPGYAVISCEENNGYGHPHEEVMERLEAMEIEVFRSDVQGTVVVTTDGTDMTWSQAPCNDYSDGN